MITFFLYVCRLRGLHDTLLPLSGKTTQAFQNLRSEGKVHSKVRASDIRHLLLLLPFIVHDLFRSEVDAWNAVAGNPQLEDPSPAIVGICLSLLEWYHLYRQPGHTTDELQLLDTLGCAFLGKCSRLFPFVNSKGMNIMCTDKVHFIIHAASEIMKWGNIINCSAEAPEIAHKLWVKAQGNNTNQGPSSAKTMMCHSQSKAAAKMCAQAIAGPFQICNEKLSNGGEFE